MQRKFKQSNCHKDQICNTTVMQFLTVSNLNVNMPSLNSSNEGQKSVMFWTIVCY